MPTTHPRGPLDEIISEEKSQLEAAKSKVGNRDSSAEGPSVEHARRQLNRAEAVADYEKLLAQGSEFKTQLLRMAAHDIKTPLTALALQVGVLAQLSGMDDARRQYLDIMARTVGRMTTMLDGFLDLARVEAGHLTMNSGKLDVVKLIRESIESFQELAKRKQLKLETETTEGLEGWGDEARLGQVLSNLVSNAIRYSPPGGLIQLGAYDLPQHSKFTSTMRGLG